MNRTYVMCFLFHLTLILCAMLTKGDDFKAQNLTVNEIGDKIVEIFRVTSKKVNELRHIAEKINNYVIDNTFALLNVTAETDLNETNFHQALNENDYFSFLSKNESKNLYLKLKSRMTRDDILNIIATRSKKSKLMKSGRRLLINSVPKKQHEEKLNDVVDKILAEIPKDNHGQKANESIYWDPRAELEDHKEYQEAKKSGRRIFKGERTNIREYPFMASIHIMGRFWCGGALYWHDLVLSSASCLQLMHNNRFFRENPRVLSVRLGSNHSRIGGEMLDVVEVYFHPAYNPRTLSNNLVAVRLRRHLAFSYRIPKIIAISHEPTSIPTTAEIMVLGWGVTKTLQKLAFEPIFLQKKMLPVYPNMFCKDVYGDKFISKTMFCAGTLTTGEGACDHDAGGPAILSGRLIGIISFGPAICGFSNTPTVFTLVGAFADWIETINETMPGYYRDKKHTTTTVLPVYNKFFATWVPSKSRDDKKRKPKVTPVVGFRNIPLATIKTYRTTPTEQTSVENETTENNENTEITETTSLTTPKEEVEIKPGRNFEEMIDDGWNIETMK